MVCLAFAFTHAWVSNIHWSFGHSLSYADLPDVDTFHYMVSKISHSLILGVICLIGNKLFKYWENVWAHGGGYRFSKTYFCLKTQILSLATNISGFPWSGRFTWSVFEKISANYSSLNNHSLSVVLPSKNSVLWKMLPVQLANKLYNAFSQTS